MKSKEAAVTKNSKGVEFLMKKNKIDVLRGHARLLGEAKLELESEKGKQEITASKGIILAMGSRPRSIPAFEVDGKRIVNSDHMLQLKEIPRRLAVLGAGAVGVEFASIFSRFSSELTLIEMLPRIVPLEDEEVSAELTKSFKKQGMDVRAGTTLESAKVEGKAVKLTLKKDEKKDEIEVDMLLVAVGRAPNSEDCGLQEAGVGLEKGYVKVDEFMRTSLQSVYAIGDLVFTPQFAHTASAEGIVAAETIAQVETRPLNYDKTPGCTYCHPEVASVGLSEAEAKSRGYEVAIGKFPWAASGKARILGENSRFREDRARDALRRDPGNPHHRPARHRSHRRSLCSSGAGSDERRVDPHRPPPPHPDRSDDGSRPRRGWPRDRDCEPWRSMLLIRYLRSCAIPLPVWARNNFSNCTGT